MTDGKLEFIYVLKLVPRLSNQKNWTAVEEAIVNEHFAALQKLMAEGKLILAGRTMDRDPDDFGVVIFTASSREEAYITMEADPAVRKGIMTARLFPYSVALINERNASK
jgi:uncharacterized protein YciI